VQRTEEYLAAHLDKPLSILELCAEVGVRERTLRYAFQDRHDMGPMAYFKYLKLNAVRSALKTSPDVSATVEQIARRWGFQHRAHFAADYMKLFGELPSTTRYGRKQVAGASFVPRVNGVVR
jgi:AraC family ethanolamine operon transcriptional activator